MSNCHKKLIIIYYIINKYYFIYYNSIVQMIIVLYNHSVREGNIMGKYFYSALDIARYVINYSNGRNYGITNLKLQKVLYFIQARFLVEGEPCFFEKIEAWDYGPVVRDVYQEFKYYGGCNIPNQLEYEEFDENTWRLHSVKFNEEIIDQSDRKVINEIVDELSDLSANDLVMITHNQAPWKNAYKKNENNVIENDSIKNYFLNR